MSQSKDPQKSPLKGTLGFARKLSGAPRNVGAGSAPVERLGSLEVVVVRAGVKRSPIRPQSPILRRRQAPPHAKNKHEERIKEVLRRAQEQKNVSQLPVQEYQLAESPSQEKVAKEAESSQEKKARTPQKVATPRVFSTPPPSAEPRKGHQHDDRRRSGKPLREHERDKHRGRPVLDTETNLGERQYSIASLRRMQEKQRRQQQEEGNDRHVRRDVVVAEGITVKDLATRMAVSLSAVIDMLKKQGFEMTGESILDADVSHLLVEEFGHRVRREYEDTVMEEVSAFQDPEGSRVLRPPVVVFVGHVDHGKTSLLDAMRSQSLVEKEKGGITQSIGAYLYEGKKGRSITFIDTPGHENFSSMRARGAQVTDLAVLIVAANDGVKEQTIEAISHIKASKVPIVLALTKCDLEHDARKIHEDLMRYDIQTDVMGGDVLSLECSAKTHKGLETLEDAIILQADAMNLCANVDRPCQGTILEVETQHGRGTVMTLLPARGTLKHGDDFVVDRNMGRVRALYDDAGKDVKETKPGVPVVVLGVHGLPSPGDAFFAVKNEATGRRLIEEREKALQRKNTMKVIAAERNREFHLDAQDKRTIGIVLRAESQGALEVLEQGIMALSYQHDTETRSSAHTVMGDGSASFHVLHKGIGGVTLADVHLAVSCDGGVISFGTPTSAHFVKMAKNKNITLLTGYILYEVLDEARKLLRDEVSKTSGETVIGRAKILKIFGANNAGRVAGCVVEYGILKKQAPCALLRDDVVIYKSQIAGLRRIKEEVAQVKKSLECGLFLNKIRDIQEGDIIECYGESKESE